MVRVPSVAGQFYEGEKEALTTQIERCFSSELGAGAVEPGPGAPKEKVLAAVSPHAGYMYSGPVAAHVFKRIAESKQAKTYVVLGPNHSGVGAPVAIMSSEPWATPFGQAQVDEKLAAELRKALPNLITEDENAHAHEHSIEVQLPFLQYVQKEFKFVPICMMHQGPDVAIELGRALAKFDDITIIASSDFTHYEPAAFASKKDHEAIKAIEELDVHEFYTVLATNNMSVCGHGPIAAAMTFAKEKGCEKGKLLKYATSGDITGDNSSVVGYAGIIFE